MTFNFLDELEAWWLDAFSDRTLAEALAATRNNRELYEASNPRAYRGGQLAGMGAQAAFGAWLPGALAATPWGQMGIAGGLGMLQGGLGSAGSATDWQTALEQALVGASIGGLTGKYLGPLPYGGTAAGFGHNYVMDWFMDLFPTDGSAR